MKHRDRFPRTMNEAFGPYAKLEVPKSKWRQRWEDAVDAAALLFIVVVVFVLMTIGLEYARLGLGT